MRSVLKGRFRVLFFFFSSSFICLPERQRRECLEYEISFFLLADGALAKDLNTRSAFKVTSLCDGCFLVFAAFCPKWVSVMGNSVFIQDVNFST